MTKEISFKNASKLSFNHQIIKQIENKTLQWGIPEHYQLMESGRGKGVGAEGVSPRIQNQKVAGLNPVVTNHERGHQS